MHKVKILPHTKEAATYRRGGNRYAFPSIDPSRTALLVIDMQNYFMEPGMPAEVPVAREIVPNINKIAGTLRAIGGTVVWVVTTFDDQIFEDWSVLKNLFSPQKCQAMIDNLCEGAIGHDLWPDLIVEEDDWAVEKNRFSAFIHGSSDLEERLKENNIDTLIITGTLTDVCCETSARDAMMRNFKTIMITDANAAACDEDHNNALNAVARLFVDVMSTDEMHDRLIHHGNEMNE